MNERHRIPAWLIAAVGAILGTISGTIAGGFAGVFVAENVVHSEGLEALGPVLYGMALGALSLSVAGAFIALAVVGRSRASVSLAVGGATPVAAFFVAIWWPISVAAVVAAIVFAVTSVARRWNATAF